MTIKELIEKLQSFPPDLPVLVDGYEGGLTEAHDPRILEVAFNYDTRRCYSGPHEEWEKREEYYEGEEIPKDIRSAILISRYDS